MMERTGGAAAGKDLAQEHYKPSTSAPARRRAPAVVLAVVIALLAATRLPSLAQPMGADQSLYAYIGERILRGERPYVDAWDQKPPAIHYVYALLRLLWPSDAVVAAADLAAALGVTVLLVRIGSAAASRAAGVTAGLLFLFLSNPAFTRLGGVRVRAQCETFIALAVTGAVYLLFVHRRASAALPPRALPAPAAPTDAPVARDVAAGALLGLAFALKYNAAVYAVAAVAALGAACALTWRRMVALAVGGLVPVLCLAAPFLGDLEPVYDATILYNLQYSGETYAGPLHFLRYLLTFPIERARTDALWTLGGAGCAALLAGAVWRRERLLPVFWVAAACLAMAINGSRGLPQYYVQVAPGLALAAGWAAWMIAAGIRRAWRPAVAAGLCTAAVVVVGTAVWRVNQFPKLLEQTWFDARGLAGLVPDDVYLARYEDERKYSAPAAVALARLMREHAPPGSPVYVFGFTAAAYVHAERPSASRFFWSRPVIVGFREGVPGYGVAGLLEDLERARPSVVALQVEDWSPDVEDSARFFMNTPPLAGWLRSHYRPVPGPEGFDVWIRRN